jgi:MYXO-CTERM domain-containing protein
VCPDNTVCTDVEGVLACVPPKMVKKGGCELAASSESGGPALLIVLLGLALPLLRRRV